MDGSFMEPGDRVYEGFGGLPELLRDARGRADDT